MTLHRWRFERAWPVHENHYFRVVRSVVRRPDSSAADYHTLDFLRPSVAVVLRDEGGRILLIKQHRFIVDREVWALPSGGVDPGEEGEIAAGRELREETGYSAGRVRHLLSYYPSYGVSNQIFHCYLAEDPRDAGEKDGNEVERTAWFSQTEIEEKIRCGEIPDGFSLTPLLYLRAGLAPQPVEEAQRCARVRPDREGKS